MKEITWTGESRMIPGHGMGVKGENKTLPVKMADSFIEQGLAKKAVTPSAKKSTKKEIE